MRIFVFILCLIFSAVSYAQPETTGIPYAPREVTSDGVKDANKDVEKKSTLKSDECPPLPNQKVDCDPNKICDPKKICKQKKPKKKPKPVKPTKKPEKCPESRVETKVIEKVVEKTKYVDRTNGNAPKHTVSFLAGIGPFGIVTDQYETGDRQDEYSFRQEKEQATGFLMGIQYQYRLNQTGGLYPTVGVVGLTNKTIMGTVGLGW